MAIKLDFGPVLTSFGPDLIPLDLNSGRHIFFSKIWLPQPLDIVVSNDHVQYQKKLMIQSSENLVTDRWTDRWTRVIS